jgi:2-keto-3-deoxy-L-rhamnonate aldolase RhmA
VNEEESHLVTKPAFPENYAKRKLAAGGLVLCMGLRQARTVDIAMIAAASGFDSVYIDMEHSPVSLEIVSLICAGSIGLGITPLVRVPSHERHDATRALDGGALGVIVPHINNRGEAEALVENCKFPPLGHRSVMGTGPALGYSSLPLREINDRLNDETLLIAMLETPEGIENANNIASVAGIDMLLIGSNDLCTELGIPGELRHTRLREAYEATARACRAHQKILGVGGIRGDFDLQSELVRMGARFIIAGSDVTYLAAAAKKDADTLRSMKMI